VPNGVEPILRVTSGLPCGTHGVRGRLGLGVAGAGCWMTTGSTRTWVHPLQCKAIGAARLRRLPCGRIHALLTAGGWPDWSCLPSPARSSTMARR
jgi:hypothetical protein